MRDFGWPTVSTFVYVSWYSCSLYYVPKSVMSFSSSHFFQIVFALLKNSPFWLVRISKRTGKVASVSKGELSGMLFMIFVLNLLVQSLDGY